MRRYLYVLQGETKNLPNGFHWDVTDAPVGFCRGHYYKWQ